MSLVVLPDKHPSKNKKHLQLIAKGLINDEEQYIFFDNSDDIKKTVVEIKGKDIIAIPIISKNQIVSAYLSGASGSGKSTYASNWAEQIYQLKKKEIDNIFLLTFNPAHDKAFDNLRKLTRKQEII